MTDYQMLFIKSWCVQSGVPVKEYLLMREYTTFRIGGPADLALFPQNVRQLSDILALFEKQGICRLVVGNGSNLLVSDDGVRTPVIFTGGLSEIAVWNGHGVMAEAGAMLPSVSAFAMKQGLSGLEFAQGIPGTMGGGTYMNCGAYGGEMARVAERVEYLTPDGQLCEIRGEKLDFSYRHSFFMAHPEYVIVRIYCTLVPDDPSAIAGRTRDYGEKRKAKQPLSYPSAGSVFKRPEGHFAGGLIEACGLKGYSVGGAQVSEKHAGFIINTGDATCSDVLRLIDHIKETVYTRCGVPLECEIRTVG